MHITEYSIFITLLSNRAKQEPDFRETDNEFYINFYCDYTKKSGEYLSICPNKTILKIAEHYGFEHFFTLFRKEVEYIDKLDYSSSEIVEILSDYYNLCSTIVQRTANLVLLKNKIYTSPSDFHLDKLYEQYGYSLFVSALFVKDYYTDRILTLTEDNCVIYPNDITRNLELDASNYAFSTNFVNVLRNKVKKLLESSRIDQKKSILYPYINAFLDGLECLYFPLYASVEHLDLDLLAQVIIYVIFSDVKMNSTTFTERQKKDFDIWEYVVFIDKYNYISNCWEILSH